MLHAESSQLHMQLPNSAESDSTIHDPTMDERTIPSSSIAMAQHSEIHQVSIDDNSDHQN